MFKQIFNAIKSVFRRKNAPPTFVRSESAPLSSELLKALLSIPPIEDGMSIYKIITEDVEGGKVGYTRLVLDGEERPGLMFNPNYTTVPVAVYYEGKDRDAVGRPIDLGSGVLDVLQNGGASHICTLRKRFLKYKNYVLVLHEELRKDFDNGTMLVCSWAGASSHVYDLDAGKWIYDQPLRMQVNAKITLDNCFVTGGELPARSQPMNYIAPSPIV